MMCAILSCIIMVFVLAGCGQSGSKGVNTANSATQELVVAVSSDVLNWDLEKFPDGDARFVWSQVYETLVRLSTDLKEQPGLAASWESSAGGLEWTFHLQKNVKFSDGSPFNAQSVVYSYGQRADVMKRKLLPLKSIEVVDDYTVKFICTKPTPLPSYLTHVAWPVMSPSSLDDKGVFKGPVGTGPYKLEKHVKDQEIVMARNANYWGTPGTLDKVVFKVIPDVSARLMALQSGQVDMALKLNKIDAKRLSSELGIKIHRKLSTFTDFMQFDTAKGPFEDVNVRRAVALTVDSQKIVKELLGGIGVPAKSRPLSSVMQYSNSDLKTEPDIAKARALLAEAGWKDSNGDGVVEKNGQPLQVNMLLAPWSPRQKIEAEAVQGQLKEAGFDLKIQITESGAITAAEKSGNFDILLRTGYYTWGDYPHHLRLHTSKDLSSHYSNQEYDQLVAQAEAEQDENSKKDLYDKLQKMIMDQVPAVYTIHEEKVIATRGAGGFKSFPGNS